VPAETDYTMRLERVGLGLTHSQLRREEQLTERDIIAYLVHSRVTEQRASEQMRALRKYAGTRQEVSRAVKMIANDEDNHLAFCHEELLRLAASGHADTIRRTLRATALAEIAIYRDVSKAVMAHLARILRWPRPKAAVLIAGSRPSISTNGSAAGGGWCPCRHRPGATHSAASRRRTSLPDGGIVFSRLVPPLFR
jgi:hypothetical protein